MMTVVKFLRFLYKKCPLDMPAKDRSPQPLHRGGCPL